MSIATIAFISFIGMMIGAGIVMLINNKYDEDVHDMRNWREEIFRED